MQSLQRQKDRHDLHFGAGPAEEPMPRNRRRQQPRNQAPLISEQAIIGEQGSNPIPQRSSSVIEAREPLLVLESNEVNSAVQENFSSSQNLPISQQNNLSNNDQPGIESRLRNINCHHVV